MAVATVCAQTNLTTRSSTKYNSCSTDGGSALGAAAAGAEASVTANEKMAAKKVAKRRSKGKSVVTMSHIHRFCAAAIADGVRFLLRPLWPLCLTVRARAQTVRLDDACAPIAQTVCNDLCSILVSAAMPHLQSRDSDPAKPRKLGAEDLLAAVVSPQNIVARARHAQAPGGALRAHAS